MNKFTLILSVLMIWGCSQAEDQNKAKEVEAVKAEVKEQVETAKEMVAEVAETVEEAASDVTAEVVEAVKEEVIESAAAKFQPGIHYGVINPAYETNVDDQVIVYEFFGYLCPHCATFEPYMKKLENDLPEHAKVVRVPVVFYPQWKPYAQAYYTFEAMDLVDQAHGAMFNAIHQHKKQFRTIEEIAVWAASSFNVDKDKFLSTAKSFMIDGQIRKGMQMMQAMGVSSTPTLVTNGKYVPNSKALTSRNDLIEITKYLVDMEAENMGLAK
ncbi:MAG: thiol:disulfide interchange protein DsbA/DsbL [Marinicella sp.]